jgi:hypothetical protein
LDHILHNPSWYDNTKKIQAALAKPIKAYRLSKKGATKPNGVALFLVRNDLYFQSSTFCSAALFRAKDPRIDDLFDITLESASKIFKHC